ncbi:MAG: protein kinase [Balneolaceae bacterium]|nr:protein kinase [Balneolaceae bacterium]
MASSFLHYDITKKIGEGGMGVVYLAQDTRLNRKVALKFLPKHISKDQSKHDRFRVEAQAAAGLNHRNIAQVYAIEEANGELCIVLEYVKGDELKDVIDENKLTPEDKIEIAIDIAEGIKAAHEKGIVHRDIKSRNIMVNSSNKVKIMDFGLARLEGSDQPASSDTTAGTTAYMSPEQLRGNEADNRSDIWSYGVVLYELFTGALPFQGMHEAAIMYSITEEEPLSIDSDNSDIPEFIRQIINRCLEKNPEDRYQQMSDVLDDIKEGRKSGSESTKEQETISLKRNTYLIISAAVFTVLLTLFIFWWNNEFELLGNVPQKKHLAVLPIENISDDPNLESISAGLTETLSFRLSDLEQYENEYWVTPASEIRSANVASASQANEMFGVNLAIHSTIQTIQDSTRLILELIDADNIVRIETEQVTVSSRNLAQLEKESVQAMLNMLQIEVQPVMVETISRGEPNNPDAYEFYLKGRASLQEPANLEMIDDAVQHFENALDIDPEFALAYAGLGEAYWRKFVINQNVELVDQAKAALNKAQSIDENLPAVQFTMGLIEYGQGNYEAAIRYFENALKLDPEYTEAYSRLMANAYNIDRENPKEALKFMKRLLNRKPEYWIGYNAIWQFII